MSKHFLVNPNSTPISKTAIQQIQRDEQEILLDSEIKRQRKNELVIAENDSLKCIEGRVIVKINIQGKNYHTFSNGLTIRRERQFNNLDRNQTEPVNAIVISSKYITEGAEILVHPNSIHDSNRIFSYKEVNSDIRYYSVLEEMCFLWRDGNDWKPLPPFELALKVYKPYTGMLSGIDHQELKDTLFVTSGELKGQVVKTIKASAYPCIFQDTNGQEGQRIRFRPFGDERKKLEEEAICILHDETEKVNSGELYVGLSIKDAKPLKDYDNT